MTHASVAHRLRNRRGLSIVELLAVFALLAILFALAVPAANSIIKSSQRSLAENQLRVAITAGRDAAIRSEGGDGAAVFFFGDDGRITAVPCVSVGIIRDRAVDGNGDIVANSPLVRREVFVPVPGVRAVQMPRGWMVRGYAGPGLIHDQANNPNGWFDSAGSLFAGIAPDGHWVFPETHFFDRQAAANSLQGHKRQTFMVRFEKQTGEVDFTDPSSALVVDVANTDVFRNVQPFMDPRVNLANARNLPETVRQIIAWPARSNPNASQFDDIQKLLGDASNDTVLVRPVTELALYREESLAAGIGARKLNGRTGTIYGDAGATAQSPMPASPAFDTSLYTPAGTVQGIQERVDAWISVDKSVVTENVAFDAQVFGLSRYLGQLQEIKP
jgi:hypothetical protein